MKRSIERIIWVGGPFFHQALAEQGLTVHFQRLAEPRVFSWQELVDAAGFVPDAVVVADKSLPPFVARMENFPCLTLFYCVDSHIHGWHPVYAQAFDLATVSLGDHVSRFAGPWLGPERILWLPAYAQEEDRPPTGPVNPEYDLLFVGTVDAVRTPLRKVFLERVAEHFPGLTIKQGNYRRLFAKARLVLNYAERGDLNFRVFEALGCGTCLLTPRLGHRQEELFQDGRDFFLYDSEDLDGLVTLAERLLADEELRRRVAAAGLAKIDAAHRATHRAQTLKNFLRTQDAEALVRQRLARARELHEGALKLLYLHQAEAVGSSELGRRYLDLARFRPEL